LLVDLFESYDDARTSERQLNKFTVYVLHRFSYKSAGCCEEGSPSTFRVHYNNLVESLHINFRSRRLQPQSMY